MEKNHDPNTQHSFKYVEIAGEEKSMCVCVYIYKHSIVPQIKIQNTFSFKKNKFTLQKNLGDLFPCLLVLD